MPLLLDDGGVGLASGGDAGAVVVLAVLQGLTEFLPISSSGHLVLAESALAMPSGGYLALNVALHVGTLVAVLAVYGRDLRRILADVLGGDVREVLLLVVGTLPAVVFGLLLKPFFDEWLTRPLVVGAGLFLTAALLVCGEWARRRRDGEDDSSAGAALTVRGALVIGLFQAVAIVPGISRSGSTIAAGLFLGLRPGAAARFSFLLAIPAVLGAAALELPHALSEGLGGLSTAQILVGMALSAIVGWFALKGLVFTLARGAFPWFALYCVLLGSLTFSIA